ncbi:MAG: nicotinamide riboside transporter PnuC [Chitinophagales bacterium]
MKNLLQANKNLILEIIAVLSGAAYTILISYGSLWCWLFAIISSIAFIYLCFSKRLLAETGLHTFYLAMGFYGFYSWDTAEGGFAPISLGWEYNFIIIIAAGGLSIISGHLLKRHSKAALPYLDAFTTIFSIIATFMMVGMVLENWIYWIVIDALSIYLYSKRGLYLSALLYLAYIGLAINGLINWL